MGENTEARNQLDAETSPYLLQHKDNPVHWLAWGPAALDRAKAEDKPILLSVGYAACHWCHVMAHESFEDAETASLMNRLFVNVKVDREERPDIDAIYQQALALFGEQGGWPLTMFLTPDGKPFWGGTYFPPEPRWGRPGFRQVLEALAEAYRDRREQIGSTIAQIEDGLAKLSQHRGGRIAYSPDSMVEAARVLARGIDPLNGGFGSAPKFPHPGPMHAMLRGWARTGEEALRQAVTLSLDALCQGGIYDHLGGGLARYSVDARWLVPHFEKMLYDNAQFIGILSAAYQAFGTPLYRQRLEETVGWLAREMVVGTAEQGGGGFGASLDADSEGEEGRFYVWDEAEIDAVLGPRASAFKAAYDVTPDGNWEGKTILNRLDQAPMPAGEQVDEAALTADRAALLKRRAARIRPAWDDKVLADWNGLAIESLARAGFALDRADWLALAEDAFGFVTRDMAEGERLSHSHRDGRARIQGMLDDYAAMGCAALALYEITGRTEYLGWAERWAETVERHFHDADSGGYFFTAEDAEALILRSKSIQDGPTPSGNGLMAQLLARLWHLTGEPRWKQRAAALIAAFAGELAQNLFPTTSLLAGIELLEDATLLVLAGTPGDPAADSLLPPIRASYLPNLVLLRLAPGQILPDGHPAAGKGPDDGLPTAYLCRGGTCSLPVTGAEALAALLEDA